MTSDARPAGRFQLLGWTFVLLLLSLPVGLPLFIVTAVGLPLMLLTVGIPLFAFGVWATRRVADAHRWIFGSVLGVVIARPYRRYGSGRGLRRLLEVLRDPATWRDLLWLLVTSTLGFVSYLLVLVLFFGIVWYAALPLLWSILEQSAGIETARDVLQTDLGFWAVETQSDALVAALPLTLLFLTLWWGLMPLLLRSHARLSRALLAPTGSATLAARVQELAESRAEAVDTQAAELRRIERDLHDGAQARLVSLGMSLGMAEELLRIDPEQAARLLAEARESSGQALAELRDLVRGMHPPVLADRGLPGAVAALALAHPLPVQVADHLPGRPPAPVESAVYFAIAEALTNVTKHARATSAEVRLNYHEGRLLATVTDDGGGGAAASGDGGLQGVSRRLSAFDGTVNVTSPTGGPTIVTLEIPCELSSAKTTPSSETA